MNTCCERCDAEIEQEELDYWGGHATLCQRCYAEQEYVFDMMHEAQQRHNKMGEAQRENHNSLSV